MKVHSVGLPTDGLRHINIVWFGNRKGLTFLLKGTDRGKVVSWPVPELKLDDEVTVKIAEDLPPGPPVFRET